MHAAPWRILRQCLEESPDAAVGIQRFFEAAADEMASDYTFGCPVAPIILDTLSVDSELAKACRAALDEWTALYCSALVRFGLTPERSERIAHLIVASLEGALITARSRRDAGEIRMIGEEMAALVQAALS